MGDRRRMTAKADRLRPVGGVEGVGRLKAVRPSDRGAVAGSVIAVGQRLGCTSDRSIHRLYLIGRRPTGHVVAVDMNVAA
ncbi:hypothetical protein D3C85_1565790 [compost metagenome]